MYNAIVRPRAIDLFSGVGGFSLGLEQAGFDVLAAVERDPVHALAHHYNFPGTATICADMSALMPKALLDSVDLEPDELDLLVGGPPCQGFSMIGPRKSWDTRNSLIFDFVRMVRGVRPKYFIMENVEGLVRGDMAGMVGELLEAFEACGYNVKSPIQILNAANYGVPQVRKRVFFVGARRGQRLPDYPQAVTTHTPTVRQAIGDLPSLESYRRLLRTDVLEPAYGAGSAYARVLRGGTSDPTDYSRPRNSCEIVTGFRRARHSATVRSRFGRTEMGAKEPISQFQRLSWDGQSTTLRAGSGREHGSFSAARPIHPEIPRCICVREAARLHSFPDWFGLHTTIWHGFRQVGNSVPPRLARVVAAEILKALGRSPSRVSEKIALGDPKWLRLPEKLARKELTSIALRKIATARLKPQTDARIPITA